MQYERLMVVIKCSLLVSRAQQFFVRTEYRLRQERGAEIEIRYIAIKNALTARRFHAVTSQD